MALTPAFAATTPRFPHVGTYALLGQGLYSFAIAADGTLKLLGLTTNAGNPSALATDGQRVYAVEEGANHIAVYAQDACRQPAPAAARAERRPQPGAAVPERGPCLGCSLRRRPLCRAAAARRRPPWQRAGWPSCTGPRLQPRPAARRQGATR